MRYILAVSLLLALGACCGAKSNEKVEDISQSSNTSSGYGDNYFEDQDTEARPGKKLYPEVD